MLWLIVLLFNVWMELNKAWSRTNKLILHTLSLMTLICWFFGYSYTKHWTKQKTNSWVTGFEENRFVFSGGWGWRVPTPKMQKHEKHKTQKPINNASEESPGPRHSWEHCVCVFFCFPFVISFLAVLVPIKASGAKNKKKQGKPKTQCLWTKCLAQTFLRILCCFSFCVCF